MAAPRQGDAVAVRLYWRATEPQNANVRPFLHLDAITGDAMWANQTKVHPGDKPSSGWPLGFFVADDYRLLLPTDTPPLTASEAGVRSDSAANQRKRMSSSLEVESASFGSSASCSTSMSGS